MRSEIGVGLRACLCSGAIFLASLSAAKDDASPIGSTRAEIVARYGEPRSVMVAGNREILWFARERVVLVNGVVAEVDRLAPDPVRPQPPPPAPAADAIAPVSREAPAAPASTATGTNTETTTAAPAEASRPGAPAPAEPEPQLAIKSVRPPSAGTRTAPEEQRSGVEPPPSEPGPVLPEPLPAAAATFPLAGSAVLAEPGDSSIDEPTSHPSEEAADTAGDPEGEATESSPLASTTLGLESSEEVIPPAEPAGPSNEASATVGGTSVHEPADSTGRFFIWGASLVAAVILIAGAAYLLGRRRRGRRGLAASAVSAGDAAALKGGGAHFTPELLARLEWKRFEELVASYYEKTGVVAVRTKSGPRSPIHIKISWKGEPRPFACVQCIAHPRGPVDAKPLQELFATISADDIRRGYAVTTGKFSAAARDFAEEKHLTLLSGDLLLEKLNALPDPARAELLKEITAGDFSTPSCPQCDTSMEPSPDDSSLWRCPKHHGTTIPRWN